MVRVSLSEVMLTCSKALEGAGLPPGVDYDAASNITWLEARGLGGIAILVREMECLKTLSVWPLPGINDNGVLATIDAQGASALHLAPGAVDLALAGRSVRVIDCRAPMIMMAEAGRRSVDGVALTVSWGVCGGKNTARCGAGQMTLSLDIRTARRTATITIRPGKSPSTREGRRLSGFHAQSLRDGILVDPADWVFVGNAAKKVLVPASAQSRSGAGAEVDDSA